MDGSELIKPALRFQIGLAELALEGRFKTGTDRVVPKHLHTRPPKIYSALCRPLPFLLCREPPTKTGKGVRLLGFIGRNECSNDAQNNPNYRVHFRPSLGEHNEPSGASNEPEEGTAAIRTHHDLEDHCK
jgi:hypothetical protein